ncbi:MAG: peptidase inhibitor family I36 protein [Chloroflexi bacterium]|nr:peptidase inhibitor family I36 protein [Chloroflexota bacterium]
MRRIRLSPVGAAAGLALAAGPFVCSGVSAHAAAADCTAGEVCVWPAANYSGAVTVVMDEMCHNGAVGSALNGDADTLQELRVYAQPNCAGTPTVVKANAQAPSVSGQSYLDWHAPGA